MALNRAAAHRSTGSENCNFYNATGPRCPFCAAKTPLASLSIYGPSIFGVVLYLIVATKLYRRSKQHRMQDGAMKTNRLRYKYVAQLIVISAIALMALWVATELILGG